MTKKFVMLATVAALFVACGSESTETMENMPAEVEATVEESMDKIEAGAEAAAAEGEAVVDEAAATMEETTEKVEEAVAE